MPCQWLALEPREACITLAQLARLDTRTTFFTHHTAGQARAGPVWTRGRQVDGILGISKHQAVDEWAAMRRDHPMFEVLVNHVCVASVLHIDTVLVNTVQDQVHLDSLS